MQNALAVSWAYNAPHTAALRVNQTNSQQIDQANQPADQME